MHKKLARQLRQHFGSIKAVPAELRPLLDEIDAAYYQFDAARASLERSMASTSQELIEQNERLSQDIIERRRSEEALQVSESKNRALIEAIPDMMIRINKEGTILDFGAEKEDKLIMPPEQFIGMSVFDILPPQVAQLAVTHAGQALASGSMQIFEYQVPVPARGGLQDFEARVVVSGENEVLAIVRNISERRQVEEALKQANVELELRVAQRTLELRKANSELQQAVAEAQNANRAKSEFLSRTSHELRTPLNSILGFGQLLEMGNAGAQDRQYVQYILQSGTHLLELINEVLDIAQIESKEMALSIEPVSVSTLTQQCLELVRPMATQRNIDLQAGVSIRAGLPDYYVLADQQRLKQVVLNLLINAIKYNREGGSVSLTWDEVEASAAGSSKRVLIKVTDTGPGIVADKLGRLFTPFDRLDAEKTGVEGTGLGLTLSQRLMEAMGGTIGVESKPGEGSTFYFDLPASDSPADSGDMTSTEEHDLVRVVLYIEDNLSNLKLVEGIVRRIAGTKILAAMQGRLGIELAREHRPDVILLDLHLPDIGGDDVLHLLKEDPVTRPIPVLILSADATPRQEERLLAAGARAYIAKPLNIQEFLKTLTEALDEAL